MSKSVPPVTTGEVGFASFFLGAGVGYVLAPRKYDLEQLFQISDDTFERALPSKDMKIYTVEQRQARDKIISGRNQIKQVIETVLFDDKMKELLSKHEYKNAYQSIKSIVPKARTQTALILGIISGVTAILIKKFSRPKN